MKINTIHILGVGGIEDLTISFDPHMNILCGPNGIGKTTVLECVAHSFAHGQTNILKRNVGSPKSVITTEVAANDEDIEITIGFDQFEPTTKAQISGRHELSPYLLSLKTTRTFEYAPLESISRDTSKEIHAIYQESMRGVSLNDLKNWFVNRYLYSAHEEALTQVQIANYQLAKECFSVLDPGVSFARVAASRNEIMVDTPYGEIYYEYLSSGFKSCLAILFGIIKEVEYRFREEPIRAAAFPGIILIDELELHLHPEWQYKVAGVLTTIFPEAQFVVTTHSPHVIQSADPEQIIALEYRDAAVALRDLPQSGYGFKGWTLDEVLTDVMGMRDTRTETFRSIMKEFGAALDANDHDRASAAFEQLDVLLHPGNHVRKLLRLQLMSLEEVS